MDVRVRIRILYGFFCVLGLATAFGCGGLAPSEEPARPNIILVSIDTLRADHIRGYGYARETTPVLDDLMSRGASFMNAVSAAPWTLPAHMSLFTSLYPHAHGVTAELLALDEGVMTLPLLLKRAGYTTGGFATMPHLSPRHGFGRGFDFYECREMKASEALPRAYTWMKQNSSKSFFLFIHLFDVHSPYEPLPHYRAMFEPSYEGGLDGTEETLYKIRTGEISLSPEDLRHLVALYDAEIRQLDNALGMFFESLEQAGVAENTVFIVTSDHGEEFLEHGGILHGRTLYDEVVRIPLIMKGPGIAAGKRVEQQVQLIDIAPTILALCGENPPASLQGRSLLPLLGQNVPEWPEHAFVEADWRNEKHDIKRAVRTNGYKLYYDRLTGEEELYDLEKDPAEQVNILGEQPDVAEALRQRLREWMSSPRGTPQTITLTETEKDQLRALGYMK
ncbi:MAG: sulfatase [Candidatus Abyssubacteria bacterium]